MSDTNVHRVVGNLLVGTSHFFVDTVNNQVGINTSSPSASLDIATGDLKVGSGITLASGGTITATAFDGDGSLLENINSDSGSWVNGTNSNVHLATSTDKVGIGTEDPDATLHVVGNAYVSSDLIVSSDVRGGYDTNTTSYFGRAAVGYCGHGDAMSISHIDSNDTGGYALLQEANGATMLNSASGQSVHIRQGNVNKMTIDSSGDVGIGAHSPMSLLHLHELDGEGVHRSLLWTSKRTNNQEPKLGYLGTADGAYASGALGLFKNTIISGTENEAVRIQGNGYSWFNGGNVGIGTSAPGAKLQIGPLDHDHLYLASANNAYGWKLDTDDQGNGAVPFRIKKRLNGSDQTILNIKNQDGYVCIGGSEIPTARLTVFNSITSSDNSIPAANLGENTAFPNSTHMWIANKHSSYAPYWGLAVGTLWSGKSYLQNLNKRTNAYYDLLLQPNGGRVAIGKTAASSGYILDVQSDDAIHIEMSSTLYETKMYGGSIFIRNPSTSSGYEHMVINNHATGSHTTSYIQFRRGNVDNGSPIGTIQGNGSTISYGTGSDYRLKENIVPMPISGLDTINNLQPKRFNFIGHPDDTYDGFIAHELQEHIPMAVTGVKDEMRGRGNVVKIDDESMIVKEDVSEPESLEEGTKWVKLSEVPVYQNVDLSKIVTYLVKAVQELSAVSEENQKTLQAVSEQNQKLESRVTLLETALTSVYNDINRDWVRYEKVDPKPKNVSIPAEVSNYLVKLGWACALIKEGREVTFQSGRTAKVKEVLDQKNFTVDRSLVDGQDTLERVAVETIKKDDLLNVAVSTVREVSEAILDESVLKKVDDRLAVLDARLAALENM